MHWKGLTSLYLCAAIAATSVAAAPVQNPIPDIPEEPEDVYRDMYREGYSRRARQFAKSVEETGHGVLQLNVKMVSSRSWAPRPM